VPTEAEESLGRRARKRAATRKAIADAALELFLEHGFTAVSIKQVADAADVAVATVFAHFPSKEALLFDEEKGFEEALRAAVTDRPAGQGLLDALESFLADAPGMKYAGTHEYEAFKALANQTPELGAYWRQTWTRHGPALAAAISDDAAARGHPLPATHSAVLARFVLEAVDLAVTAEQPRHTLAAAFTLLRAGWNDEVSTRDQPHRRDEDGPREGRR
jgi:AcrR family transcriptional regulator